MHVPFNDLSRIHKIIEKPVLKKFKKVIEKNSFILNEDIESFENNFAKFTNQKYSISCNSGTDALELILRGLDIGQDDEVIVPVNSFVSTSFAVDNVGAKPIFVDNDEYYLIDLEDVNRKLTKKTKAVIGVNLYGQMCDVKKLKKICDDKKIYFIEDAAQSHGASQGKNFVGDESIAAGYSFYPGKNLGGWGDGGAITTNSNQLYKKLIKIRNVGSKVKYIHDTKGINSRLQPLQAIVLNEKLKFIDLWTEDRRLVAESYISSMISNKKIDLPKVQGLNNHVWHLFVIRVKNRKKFIDHCKNFGIETGIHYPTPIIKQKAYKDHWQYKKSFENSFSQHKQLVSLPIFPMMSQKEINYVIEVVNKY